MRIASLCSIGIVLITAAGSTAAAAAPVESVVGVDVSRGPEERVTRGAFAGIGVGFGPRVAGSLAIAASDDSEIGKTSALIAGLGIATSATTRLRLRGVRSLGTGEAPGFVRVLAGPEFGPVDATRLGLFYVFEANDAGDRSDGARGELAVPVDDRWTARAGASWATVPGANDAFATTLGASFVPVRRLELVGELGVARGTALSGTVPTQGPLDRFLGDPPPEAAGTATKATPIALVGFRVTLP